MTMKKTLTLLLLLTIVLPLSGQKARVPKHEFGFGLGVGPGSWLFYCNDNITDLEWKTTSLGSTFTGGLTYTWHFTPKWGLTTGLGVYKVDGQHIRFYGETSYLEGNETDGTLTTYRAREPDTDHPGPYFIDIIPYEFAVEIPLMIQLNLPIKNAFQFYTMAGFRFGLVTDAGADGTCRITDTRKITYSESPFLFADTGWQPYPDKEALITHDNSGFNKMSVSAMGEVGLRIPIWGVTGISVGLYGAVGLNNLFPLSDEGPLMKVDKEHDLLCVQNLANARVNPRYDEQNHKFVPAAEEHYLMLRSVMAGLRVRFMF